MPQRLEVVTVGHAIVDVLTRTEDQTVADLGFEKGTMTLVDDETSERVYRSLGQTTTVSGGSACNTAVGLASFGASVGLVAKVAADELGKLFIKDIRDAGVTFDVPASGTSPGTGRCLVLVTPDGQRTMGTSLGVGDFLAPEDVDAAVIAAADLVYIEGYLCGLEHTDPTVEATLKAAEAGGTTVALSLSDPFWIQLHGAEMSALLDRVQLLFANEDEARGLVGTDDLDVAVDTLAKRVATVVVTRGAKGSLVSSHGQRVEVPAEPVAEVVDTTGAGDLYAAGYIYGHVRGLEPAVSARLGSLAAAEVIAHLGARPLQSLETLAAPILQS